MMSKEPAERPPSAEGLASSLLLLRNAHFPGWTPSALADEVTSNLKQLNRKPQE